MGKKNINKKIPTTSQEESLKASKNNNSGGYNIYKKKNDLSDLAKVLRPKVYITDNSSFKSLVQDLTGIRSTTTSFVSSSSSSKAPILVDVDSESSFEAELFDRAGLGQESNQTCHGGVGLAGEQEEQIVMSNGQDLDLDLDSFDYWDLESWLLNPSNDPYSFYHDSNGFDQFQNDVSIYDYGFSGML